MRSSQTSEIPRVSVENIGGIDSTSVELDTGVNILTGENATNRTSFLRSIMAALGSDQGSLKGDADHGSVTLTFGDNTYERRFNRQNGHVVTDGNPLLDDPTLADLFAFLLESNTARKAVSQQQDLRDVIMRPVDIDEIQANIQQAEAEKRRLDQQIESLAERKSQLPALEERRQTFREQLEEAEAELAKRREELEKAREAEPDTGDEDLDEQLEALQRARNDLEDITFQQETEIQSIERLETQLEGIREELESLPDALETEPSAIEAELESLRDQKSALDSSITQLQSIIQFNEEMLEGTNPEITATLNEGGSGSVTDQLVADDSSVVCWTCGSTVDRSQIEETIDRLRSLREEKSTERNELLREINDRKQTLKSAKETKQRRQTLLQRRDETESEIEQRKTRLEELEENETDLRHRVDDLEETVSELEEENESETLDRQKAVTEAEFRVEQKRQELDDVETNIEESESAIDRIDDLRDERESVANRLTDLRTRIDRIEQESVEAFNGHMESVLEVLEYENIERIWIEQTEQTVKEGRRKVEQSTFTLHIIRQSENGQTYEDTIEHLSESEREVTGLVFALAGYLVHDVHEETPFMLLDSLEAIDSNRIAKLVEYFSQYAETVVIALLPADAATLDDDYKRVTSI
ncbi:AAA family ATPase [Halobacteria archaeon AArc-curdl1]|uniref:AAA family ATPase n=1 Tax=Natronosalvus hydrolyticus TaxID=2979988 RepID=A0AAP3E5V6_9EURY|nr:AAA family ATPase [Halobacteria archaeon AArc-curdl1]